MSDNTAVWDPPKPCAYCSGQNGDVYHYGRICPRVKAIEYFQNGAVKRVEFWDEREISKVTIREG